MPKHTFVLNGERVTVEVANTGQWLRESEPNPESTRIGLDNLRQRLARYYGPQCHPEVVTMPGWVCVRLNLPRAGVKRMVVCNSHGGNVAASKVAVADLTTEFKIPIVTTGYFHEAEKEFAALLVRQKGTQHACEAETSMIMALAPAISPPTAKPWIRRRTTSRIGARMPTWS